MSRGSHHFPSCHYRGLLASTFWRQQGDTYEKQIWLSLNRNAEMDKSQWTRRQPGWHLKSATIAVVAEAVEREQPGIYAHGFASG